MLLSESGLQGLTLQAAFFLFTRRSRWQSPSCGRTGPRRRGSVCCSGTDLFSGVGAILDVAVAARRYAEANVAPETTDAFLAWLNVPHFREVLQTEQRASFRERGEN